MLARLIGNTSSHGTVEKYCFADKSVECEENTAFQLEKFPSRINTVSEINGHHGNSYNSAGEQYKLQVSVKIDSSINWTVEHMQYFKK